MGPLDATAAFKAATLFSRPTWSGTIISGKMTVSRRATRGSSRGPTTCICCSSSCSDGRSVIGISSGRGHASGHYTCDRALGRLARPFSLAGEPAVGAVGGFVGFDRPGGLGGIPGFGLHCRGRRSSHGLVEVRFQEPRTEPLFELEEKLHPREVDASFLGQA